MGRQTAFSEKKMLFFYYAHVLCHAGVRPGPRLISDERKAWFPGHTSRTRVRNDTKR